jgi:acetyl-CoA acetyltransferase
MMDYGDVVACAPVTVAYQRRSEKPAQWWLARALAELLRASGVRKQEVDGLCLSSFSLAPDGPAPFVQYVGLAPRMLDFLPTGGACGIMALRRAARAVQCGDASVVACIAGDANGATSFHDLVASFSTFARDCVWPYGAGGPNLSFAMLTDHYMRRFGATREDFGRICIAQRANATRNPAALLQAPLGMADYLASRPIAEPVHLLDCVMPCAGADGFLVMRRARAEELGLPFVRLLAAIERHNGFPDDPIQERGGWAQDRDLLWQRAGVGPGDIDVVETYDDYPVIVMMQFEDLGFCGKGEAPDFVRGHDLTVAGDLPHNTGGGQLSCGQAGAAGGYLGLVEAMRQLTGAASGRQVERARHALVSGFGMINYDRGICTAAAVLAAGTA